MIFFFFVNILVFTVHYSPLKFPTIVLIISVTHECEGKMMVVVKSAHKYILSMIRC